LNEEGLRRANGVGKNDVEELNSPHPSPSPFPCGPLPLAVVEKNVVGDRREGERKAAAPSPSGQAVLQPRFEVGGQEGGRQQHPDEESPLH
ncbi:unnamed protein product, partial [Ectocarpus sp. 12 AP-2014]